MRIVRTAAAAIAACVLLAQGTARAQTPPPSVSVSFGVDTTAVDVGDIVHLLRAYLAQPDTSAGTRGLWSTANEFDRRAGDLGRYFAYQGFPATVLGVTSAAAGDSAYVIKVLYANADSSGQEVRALALQRLYAVRVPAAPYGWQLSNALPRLTAGWPASTVGRVTFHYGPGTRANAERAMHAARFVDSVATLFDVPPPPHVDYFVTTSPDEYHRIVGLDFFVLPSGRGTATGGKTLSPAGVVLAGDPAQGEAYLHELVHMVVGGRLGGGWILGEGVPTWFGGSKGRSTRAMYALLVDYQRTHADVTLASLVKGEAGRGDAEDDALYATGALFTDAVYRRKGAEGLRALAGTPREPAALLAAMARGLGIPASKPEGLERWWRKDAPAAAGHDR